MSMAGMTSILCLPCSVRGDGEKVIIKLQAQGAALLRVELGRHEVASKEDAGERDAVVCLPGHQGRVLGLGVISVNKKKVGAGQRAPATSSGWLLTRGS